MARKKQTISRKEFEEDITGKRLVKMEVLTGEGPKNSMRYVTMPEGVPMPPENTLLFGTGNHYNLAREKDSGRVFVLDSDDGRSYWRPR